ncbi:MAG TPA: BlaI/MecI/CopY family transcriptional regulator [Gemmatimonadaceae bacterium]|jgi:predicted transcriptional regulator|nr:BlaI/MecI/CopY family transcriptional regulator [Gemmatimonadaceae bacterium]
MSAAPNTDLGRRERQIMDVVYRLGRASVGEVRDYLADPPSYSAVRGMLNLLEDKGHLTHEQDGLRYVYKPTAARSQLRRSALRHLVQTFFDGSPTSAVAALLEMADGELSASDRARLAKMVAQAKAEGK